MTRNSNDLGNHRGFSLLEVTIAMVVLLIGLGGMMNVFVIAVSQNASQEDATRTTEYAQDKMEQLMALSFADAATNTTVYPPAASGGTGLGSTMAANATVGSINSASPASGYVDYLSSTGALLTSSSGAYYVRQWTIGADASAKLKTITVYSRAMKSLTRGSAPSTTLVSIESQ